MTAGAFLRLRGHRRGGVLVEFAFSALLLITTLLTTLELGIEMFVRESAERAATVAARHYATTRSMSATDAAVARAVPGVVLRCLEPVEVRLYTAISGSDLTDESAGFAAQDDAGDAAAGIARVTLGCTWERMTPVVRAVLGPEWHLERSVFTRMRD